jgi:DNA polymerase alpha subunit B
MADATVAELNERFGSGDKPLEADVLAELQSIMRIHQLDAQDLFFKWESYCIKMDLDGATVVSYNTARAFKKDLQDALERNHRAAPQLKADKRVGATPRAAAKGGSDVFGMLEGLTTPGTGRVQKTSATKRSLETPSVSRIKAVHMSSSPDYKSPSRIEDQLNALGAMP